jgi:hypothetical protein
MRRRVSASLIGLALCVMVGGCSASRAPRASAGGERGLPASVVMGRGDALGRSFAQDREYIAMKQMFGGPNDTAYASADAPAGDE